jgi:hypothetical protein
MMSLNDKQFVNQISKIVAYPNYTNNNSNEKSSRIREMSGPIVSNNLGINIEEVSNSMI